MASDPYADIYAAAGQAFGVDPAVLAAQHIVEDGGGDANTRSPAGAIGHMQIMPATAKALAVNPTDPVQSIWGAANLMSQNMKATGGDVADALRMYNAGPDRSRWNNPETQAYVGKVAANYTPAAAPQAQPDPAPMAQPAQQPAQGPDAYSALFGSTDPASAPNSTPQPGGDAYSSMFGDTDPKAPNDVKAAWHQGTALGNFARGIQGGVDKVGSTLDSGLVAAIHHIPGATAVLQGTGLNPDDLTAADKAQAAEAQVQYGGSPAYGAGTMVGSALASAPIVTAGAALVPGMAGLAAAGRLGSAAAAVPQAVAAGGLTDGNFSNALANAGMGAAGGAVAPTLAKYGSKLVRLVTGADDGAPAITSSQLATPPAANALAAPAPATTSEPAAPASPTDGDAAAAQAQPEAKAPGISLGVIPSKKNAPALAQAVYDHYAAGGPTALTDAPILGVQLTAAQATGNANLARLENMMRDQYSNKFQQFDADQTAKVNAYVQNVIGTPDDIAGMTAVRDQATAAARNAAFANKTPIDPQPTLDAFDAAIARNRGNTSVVNALTTAKNNVLTAVDLDPDNGATVADPEHFYNARKDLGYAVSSKARGTTSDLSAAASQLTPIMGTMADNIETGAPGFKDYLQQFNSMSQPIDAATFLQGKSIVNPDGNVQRGPLNNLITSIQKQQNLPGARTADGVTPEQVQALTNARDTMNMIQRKNLGRSAGSNTAQNLYNASKVNSLMSGAGGAVANLVAGGGGAALGGGMEGGMAALASRGVQTLYQSQLAATRAAAESQLVNKLMLRPGS